VYQPAAWNGDPTQLLTQYLAYLPSSEFDTLNSYLKTDSSPLFNQTGLPGQLAAQINTAFPLGAAADTTTASNTTNSDDSAANRKRDIIIGVCVGLGGLLWIGLVFWIYKRIRRSNDQAVHKRLSEHMSMFSGQRGVRLDEDDRDRRFSQASIAASEVDDRPSSFYASPLDHDRSMRQRSNHPASYVPSDEYSYPGSLPEEDQDISPNGQTVFGNSWFQQQQQHQHQHQHQLQHPIQPNIARPMRGQNPFEDIVTRSYLNTSGSGHLHGGGAGGGGAAGQRRSQLGWGAPVQKGMISRPTLQATSLEFNE